MKHYNTQQFIATYIGFFAGVMLYGLFFHRDDSFTEVVIRALVVSLIASLIQPILTKKR